MQSSAPAVRLGRDDDAAPLELTLEYRFQNIDIKQVVLEQLASVRAAGTHDSRGKITQQYGNLDGTFMAGGFCCPLLLQIAEDLRAALAGIRGTATLRKVRAIKYDSQLGGISRQADFAVVNVTSRITPDPTTRDPDSGELGLSGAAGLRFRELRHG